MEPENTESEVDILLVVPCFHESKRLPKFLPRLSEAIKNSRLEIELLLVGDNELPTESQKFIDIASEHQKSYPFIKDPMDLGRNFGKGYAIRAGWSLESSSRWLAFVDADGAISARETIRFLEELEKGAEQMQIAVRAPKDSRLVKRLWHRQLVASCLNFGIRSLYRIKIRDTQCGLKAISRHVYHEIAADLKENRYGFDLELILRTRASGASIREIPVEWTEIPGSHMRARDALSLIFKVLFKRL